MMAKAASEGSYPVLFSGRPLAQGRPQSLVELLPFVSNMEDSIENERKARTEGKRLEGRGLRPSMTFLCLVAGGRHCGKSC
jgi:hypothetical protein